MRYLDLFENQLSGAIPAALGGLSDLRSLTLSDNRLSGAIPAELGGAHQPEVPVAVREPADRLRTPLAHRTAGSEHLDRGVWASRLQPVGSSCACVRPAFGCATGRGAPLRWNAGGREPCADPRLARASTRRRHALRYARRRGAASCPRQRVREPDARARALRGPRVSPLRSRLPDLARARRARSRERALRRGGPARTAGAPHERDAGAKRPRPAVRGDSGRAETDDG